MWLASRYGSSRLVPFVQGVLAAGTDCSLEAAAVVFLLRHDPDAALAHLSPSQGPRKGCVAPPWSDIARHVWDSQLERAVLAHLPTADAWPLELALMTLAEHGSPAITAPLIERLAQWEQEWRGRAAERARVRSLCVTDRCRAIIDRYADGQTPR